MSASFFLCFIKTESLNTCELRVLCDLIADAFYE